MEWWPAFLVFTRDIAPEVRKKLDHIYQYPLRYSKMRKAMTLTVNCIRVTARLNKQYNSRCALGFSGSERTRTTIKWYTSVPIAEPTTALSISKIALSKCRK
jgi:hypothetical protein